MALPVIHTEDTSGHVTGFIQPDREFWRYLFAELSLNGCIAQAAQGDIWTAAVESADRLLAELEERKEGGDG